MFMKNLAVVFFIFNSFISLAQRSKYDVMSYYSAINQAEKFALDSNYTEALVVYKKTLDTPILKLPKDYLIAAQIASINNDDTLTTFFLKKSILCGATAEWIENCPALKKYCATTKWQDIKISYYDIRNKYLNSVDTSIRKVVEKLYINDQIIRDKNEKFLSNRILKLRPRLYKKWQKNCLISFKTLDSIISIKGFPSYGLIGVDRDGLPKINKYQINSNIALVIIYHYDKCYSEYGYKLIDEVFKGNLHPYHFALIRDMESKVYELGRSKDVKYKNYEYYVRWQVSPINIPQKIENELELDKKRVDLGLLPFVYERKKKTAQNKFNYFRYILNNFELSSKCIDWFYYDM